MIGKGVVSVLLVAVAVAVVAGCTPSARVASVTYGGATYEGGVGGEFAIEPADLTAVGQATNIAIQSRGDTVYSLAGVDPGQAIVMDSADATGPYLILFRSGIGGGQGTPMTDVIPGLCQYLATPDPSCG